MVSLIDIGPSKGSVTVRGQSVEVNGISAENIFEILLSFPEMRMLLTQQGGVDQSVVVSLLMRFPEAAGMIIAAGTGANLSDASEEAKAKLKQHVDAARGLNVGEQFEVFDKIIELTFPRGVQNFLDAVQGLLKRVGLSGLGWGPGTISPAPSPDASPQVATKKSAGAAPPDS